MSISFLHSPSILVLFYFVPSCVIKKYMQTFVRQKMLNYNGCPFKENASTPTDSVAMTTDKTCKKL